MKRAALWATLAGAACGSDRTPTQAAPLAPCAGAVSVTVSRGARPQFTWSPACLAAGLEVRADEVLMWRLTANGASNTIAPPQTYGFRFGATTATTPVPLVLGDPYTVVVFRAADGELVEAGHADVTLAP